MITERIREIPGFIPHGEITRIQGLKVEECLITVITNRGQNIEFDLRFKYRFNPNDFSKEIVCPIVEVTNNSSVGVGVIFNISREDAKSVFDFRMAINRFVGELCSL